MKHTEVKYEKPKQESYTPKEGKRAFIIYEKIDTTKSLQSIIKDNIPNVSEPSSDKEFIENQILLDYIISQKYKNNKTIFDYNIDSNENPGFETLSMFFKSKDAKVYYDNSISKDLYKYLRKYYKAENNFEKKIRIRLNLEEDVLKDEKKIESIVNQIINKVSKITGIKNEELHVTNVRKNCLLLDIVRLVSRAVNNVVSYFVGKIKEKEFNNSKGEFRDFLRDICNEQNGNNFTFRNGRGEIEDVIVDVRSVLSNYVTDENLNEKFDRSHDKSKGSFGRPFYLWFTKSTNYYPNKNCEGYGLKINKIIDGIDIFQSDRWCTIYTNVMRNKAYDSIEKFSGEYIEKRNNDGTIKKFRVFFQCKAKISTITVSLDHTIIFDEQYLVPYRLIKENL